MENSEPQFQDAPNPPDPCPDEMIFTFFHDSLKQVACVLENEYKSPVVVGQPYYCNVLTAPN